MTGEFQGALGQQLCQFVPIESRPWVLLAPGGYMLMPCQIAQGIAFGQGMAKRCQGEVLCGFKAMPLQPLTRRLTRGGHVRVQLKDGKIDFDITSASAPAKAEEEETA